MMTLTVTAALCACGGGKGSESSAGGNDSEETKTAVSAETETSSTPQAGGEVTVGIAQDLDSLDPHKMAYAGTREVLFNVFEGLVKPDPNGDLIPAVASDIPLNDESVSSLL